MSREIDELREHAEEAHPAQHDPHLTPISLTMAILAVCAAAVSLLGHRAHTEELLLQNKATSQWAYYQAKNIRRHTYELFLDLMAISELGKSEASGKIREKYSREMERYKDQQQEIGAEAQELEKETALERKRADRFDLGEVFLEVALVITSLTLLTGRRYFWACGLILAVVGLGIAGTGFLVH